MVWTPDGPQGNESEKIKWELVPYTRGRVLDLGCGPFKAFPHFVGVDSGHHDEQFGWQNKADIISDCEKLDLIASQSCDAVFSSHLLEHIENTKKALKEWWRVLKQGGHLCLYLPHKSLYPNIGQPGSNPDHKHDFMPADIIEIMKEVGGWDLLRNETRSEGHEYSFFQVYRKRTDNKHIECIKHRPEKSCAVVRYGAFGDLIMASSIFPALKDQGYHITLYTTPSAWEVVKNDPHIDDVIIQDKDQIPNEQLGPFWAHEAAKYDKFVNLSESIEGTLLPVPGRINHQWPDSVRRVFLNRNYLEWTHALAEVPMPSRQKFYPTEKEMQWAKQERAKIKGRVILWSLSGSSLHKTWPWFDTVIARFLIESPDVTFILVGDEACKILEQGWEDEPRVICRSGVWSIRESMTFCEVADMVVGCETGLLNAAGMLETPKVCILSHSSVENLTKHWKNTISLEPKTACYPCHRMHYGFDFCYQHEESGTAQCQADVGPDEMYDAIKQGLNRIWPDRAA